MSESAMPNGERFPTAIVRSNGVAAGLAHRAAWAFWLIAATGLAGAVVAVVISSRETGPLITIRFQEGHGIKPGDALKHRGIDVGEVESVGLNESFDGVHVRVRLDPDAAAIAREGSRFWIERPQVSLARVSGLETVVGAKYIGVVPGPSNHPLASDFVGAEAPLTISPAEASTSAAAQIVVHFSSGFGLTTGSPVKHRGIVVGEVTGVDLDEDVAGINVTIRLVQSAHRLARQGTRFWIERPNLSLAGVQGLDTIVNGQYVALRPGPANAAPSFVFDGLDLPPMEALATGGLELRLLAAQRQGLERGAPVNYRGLRVGTILSVGLSPDAQRVESRILIFPEFQRLVRANTRFWNTSGMDFHVGLKGIEFNLDTLATVAAGGVAFATPTPAGEPAHTGQPFGLEPTPPDDWQDWSPRIAVGSSLLPDGAKLPDSQRAALKWKTKSFGFPRLKQRVGWVLPLDDGRWVAPASLVTDPNESYDGSAVLEVAGMRVPLGENLVGREPLAFLRIEATSESAQIIAKWPATEIRSADIVEDIVLTTGPQEPQLPISTKQLTAEESSWRIGRSVPLAEDWNGASALARRDAKLIGIATISNGEARIVPLGPYLTEEGVLETAAAR